MKIWIDLLTPKQLLFFESMINRLRKHNKILCTSRNYREVKKLAEIRKMKLKFVGKHGGADKFDKLHASIKRLSLLSEIIENFDPDITISFCSPEATRISYGLGIKHIAFSDSPHAKAVMTLSIPFIEKLLKPWIIPNREFTRYGITKKNILSYKAIDAALIVKHKPKTNYRINFSLKDAKTILIRTDESDAAYFSQKNNGLIQIIDKILREFKEYNVIVLCRYNWQIRKLRKKFGRKFVFDKVVDGEVLLNQTDFFVGGGGTMTAQAALMGIPTISYNSVPNHIERYLVRKKLVKRETNPRKIVVHIRKKLNEKDIESKKRARQILNSMEDPFPKLVKVIKSITK